MTHFVIHVGPHKTGSSYLQEAFTKLRPELAKRGFHYPSNWGSKAHHKLLELLKAFPDPGLEAEFEELHAARHPVVIISVEGLVSLTEPNVVYFKDLLRDAPVTVVFYARSWADLLPSHYKEEVKTGKIVDTFPEYLCPRLHNPPAGNLLNFGRGLSIYAQVFGQENIKIVSYDQVLAKKLDLFEHFVKSILRISDLPDANLERVWVSPGPIDVEILRALSVMRNLQPDASSLARSPLMYLAAYMKQKKSPNVVALSAELEQYVDTVLINERSGSLLALHRELFQTFGDALVAPRLKRFIFKPRRADVKYVRPNYAYDPKIVSRLQDLKETLAKSQQPVAAV